MAGNNSLLRCSIVCSKNTNFLSLLIVVIVLISGFFVILSLLVLKKSISLFLDYIGCRLCFNSTFSPYIGTVHWNRVLKKLKLFEVIWNRDLRFRNWTHPSDRLFCCFSDLTYTPRHRHEDIRGLKYVSQTFLRNSLLSKTIINM